VRKLLQSIYVRILDAHIITKVIYIMQI